MTAAAATLGRTRLSGLSQLLGVAHRQHRRAWELEIADLELTAPAGALLRLIAGEPGLGVREIARRLATDPMNVARLADGLHDRELIETLPDPADARRRPLHPTSAGRALATELGDRAEAQDRRLAAELGEPAYDALLDGLGRLAELDGLGEPVAREC